LPSNLEIKARTENLQKYVDLAKLNNANYVDTFHQIDTYFDINYGKLKIREIVGKKSELIFYNRSGDDFWQSDYIIADVSDVKNIKKILSNLFETKVIVEKNRTLYQIENARIHFDIVNDLGTFIEFEVVILYGDEQAQELLNKLRNSFNIQEKDIIKCSYSDLLMKNQEDDNS
jgi:adenylate cyclase, class 2